MDVGLVCDGITTEIISYLGNNNIITNKSKTDYKEIRLGIYEIIEKAGERLLKDLKERIDLLSEDNSKLKEKMCILEDDNRVLKNQIKTINDKQLLNDSIFSTYEFVVEANKYLCSVVGENFTYFNEITEDKLDSNDRRRYQKVINEIGFDSNVVIGYMKELHGGKKGGGRNDLTHEIYKINDEKTLMERLYCCIDYKIKNSKKRENMKKFVRRIYDFIKKGRGCMFEEEKEEELPDID